MAGSAACRSGASGISHDRHGSALRAQRISVVFHVDCAAAMLLSKRGLAAAHGVAVSFLQNFHQLPRGWRLAVRSTFSVDDVCAVLRSIGLGDIAAETNSEPAS